MIDYINLVANIRNSNNPFEILKNTKNLIYALEQDYFKTKQNKKRLKLPLNV